MSNTIEFNYDSLIGPTHNYAGLAQGNVASINNSLMVSNPKAAALQGLAKMHWLYKQGVPQAIIPPLRRPNIDLLRSVGFTGSIEQILRQARRDAPELFEAVFSASAMWAANAATVSPSCDSADGRIHITPANCVTYLHRQQETADTARLLQTLFPGPSFVHHQPLPFSPQLGDEGAANHTRFSHDFGLPGVNLFIYGVEAFSRQAARPRRFPARQSREASEAVARLHQLSRQRVIFLPQSLGAIDAGVFHNDVIAVGHKNIWLYHELAFATGDRIVAELTEKLGGNFYPIKITTAMLSLEAAVESYLFNSQIVTLADGRIIIIAPSDCVENVAAHAVLQNSVADNTNPIDDVVFFDIRQSMRNGGGPACLRLRVELTPEEQKDCLQQVWLTDRLYEALIAWVEDYYRDRLSLDDLLDPEFCKESFAASDALAKILF